MLSVRLLFLFISCFVFCNKAHSSHSDDFEEENLYPQVFIYGTEAEVKAKIDREDAYLAAVDGDWQALQAFPPSSDRYVGFLLAVFMNSTDSIVTLHQADRGVAKRWELAVELAIEENHVEALEILMERLQIKRLPIEDFYSCFVRACHTNGPAGAIEVLARRGVFASEPNRLKQLFLLACKDGDARVVEGLLLFVNPVLEKFHGLCMAIQRGHLEVVKMLLAENQIEVSENQHYPLRLAIAAGHLHVARFLLAEDTTADLQHLSNIAMHNGNYHLIRLLGLPSPDDNDGKQIYRVKKIEAVKGHMPYLDSTTSLMRYSEILNEASFGRLLMKITAKDRALVHTLLIESDVTIVLEDIFLKKAIHDIPRIQQLKPQKMLNPSLKKAMRDIPRILQLKPQKMLNPLPFLVAVESGFPDVVKAYIQDGRLQPSPSDLFVAIRNGHVGIVQLLLPTIKICSELVLELVKVACTEGHLMEARAIWEDDRVADRKPIAPLMFEAACRKGDAKIASLILQDESVDVYELKEKCLLQASKAGHFALLVKLLKRFHFQMAILEKALADAAFEGHASIVRHLAESAGVNPTASENKAFQHACMKGQQSIIWYLFQFPRVRNWPSAIAFLTMYLLRTNDFKTLRHLYLESDPKPKFHTDILKRAYGDGLFHALATFFADPDLVALQDKRRENACRIFLAARDDGHVRIIQGIIDNMSALDATTLNRRHVIRAARKGLKDVARVLLRHPRRTGKSRYQLLFKLLLKSPDDAYVQDVMTEEDLATGMVQQHLKYYLPFTTLNRIYPSHAFWKTDRFLAAANTSELTIKFPSPFEKLYANLFFDRCMGMFGKVQVDFVQGGWREFDWFYIRLLQGLEELGKLTPSPQLEQLKKHLHQVADAVVVEDQLTFKAHVDRDKIEQAIQSLHIDETYLVTLNARANGSGHTAYGLVARKSVNLLNVKIFNSDDTHDLNRAAYPNTNRIAPYIEWDDIPMESFLSMCTKDFDNYAFRLSDDVHPTVPPGLSYSMLISMQDSGTCSAFKFWLIARHDLENLPRFMELFVALHLAFLEYLAVHFDATMKRWDSATPRVWLTIISTPHFEAQLLKKIEAVREEDPAMYSRLRSMILKSVQTRYNLFSEKQTEDFISWKECFLESLQN